MAVPVQIGQLLAGKYRVEKVLGEGGMGVVVAAFHIELEALVALKFLLPEILGNAAAIDRFLREARAAVRLKSEHTCQVKDVGRLESGAPYIVMEHLEGNDLMNEIQRRGALSTQEAASYVLQACTAMSEAHALGIIHRDLKPQNLMLTRRADGTPLVKVLDFGIAKHRVHEASATHSSVVMGSPAYMAPEQARSAKQADARADIYSLGVILYQLTTGRLPYAIFERKEPASMTEILLAVQMDPVTPLRSHNPTLGGAWEQLVMRAIAKEPAQRWQTIADLVAALESFANMPAMPGIGRRLASPAALIPTEPPDEPIVTIPDVRVAPTVIPHHISTTLGAAAIARTATPFPVARRRWVIPTVVAGIALAAILFVVGRFGSAEPAADPVEAARPPTPPSPSRSEPPAVSAPTAITKPPVDVPAPLLTAPLALPANVASSRPRVVDPKPRTAPPLKPPDPKSTEPPKPASPKPSDPPPAKPCDLDDVVCQFGTKSAP